MLPAQLGRRRWSGSGEVDTLADWLLWVWSTVLALDSLPTWPRSVALVHLRQRNGSSRCMRSAVPAWRARPGGFVTGLAQLGTGLARSGLVRRPLLRDDQPVALKREPAGPAGSDGAVGSTVRPAAVREPFLPPGPKTLPRVERDRRMTRSLRQNSGLITLGATREARVQRQGGPWLRRARGSATPASSAFTPMAARHSRTGRISKPRCWQSAGRVVPGAAGSHGWESMR